MKLNPLHHVALIVGLAGSAHAQIVPQEIAELRKRVAGIRAEMAQVTAAAEYAADLFTRDTAARLLFSTSRSPAMRAEFGWHTGASPEMQDADEAATRGIVIFPVAAWEVSGFTVAALVERWQGAGRPTILLGSTAGKPEMVRGRVVPNGAPDGSKASAQINEAANLVAAWVFYVEFVAAATRHNWTPGIYVSHLVPRADDSNYKLRFRAPPSKPVTPIAAGTLGNQYLDRIDSLMLLAARPLHVAAVQRAADSLRAVRTAGHRVFVGACANYMQVGVAGDSLSSPFRPVYAHWDVATPLLERGAKPGDAVLWFGYDGYDCPHIDAAAQLSEGGYKVVVMTDNLPAKLPPNVLAGVPLATRTPERIGKVAFNSEGVGSASSVEALIHYLWIKRLVAAQP